MISIKYKIRVTLFVCIFFGIFNIFSQNTNNDRFILKEDSIKMYFNRIRNTANDSEKDKINKEIIRLFGEILSDTESFDYQFKSLKYVSKLKSSDNKVRIINWNLAYNDISYKYFGYIQYLKNKNSDIKLFKLNDNSSKITNPKNASLDNKNWYGALYFKILVNKVKKRTYYTLFGWDGNTKFTTKKIIDAFYIKDNGKLKFNANIFEINRMKQKRIIFEYAKAVKMMIRWDKKIKMIVYDHLVPIQKKFTGQYQYYGPDMSQDGLKFENKLWLYKPNLDMRNTKR